MTEQLSLDYTRPPQSAPAPGSWEETAAELARQRAEKPLARETSVEAWQSVMACGWAMEAARLSYAALYESGPLTLLELERAVASKQHRPPVGRSESTAVRRLYDLRDAGLVRCTEQYRVCAVSRKKAVTWDVTLALAPSSKPEKKIRELKSGDSVVIPLRYEDSPKTVRARVTRMRGQIYIAIEGYGECEAEVGHGQPVLIELSSAGLPRVVVWADINQVDPTHVVGLERAHESFRQVGG